MPNFQFEKGDLVALLSHPYLADIANIVQSGDPLQQSPVMIVSESLEVKKNEKSTSQRSLLQHKCFWYSTKTNGFESAWISETFLKLIEKGNEILDTVPEVGDQLLFRTTQIELHKRKSSFYQGADFENSSSTHISSLLSFVAPVLMVAGYVNKDSKSGSSEEIKAGRVEEYNFIKVTWFNYNQDKISETILPVSCLKLLPVQPKDNITKLQSIIDKKQFVKIKLNNVVTIIKPISVNYLSGYYFLRGHDFIRNKIVDNIKISELVLGKIYNNPVLERAPMYDFKKGKKPILYPEELIQKAKRKKKLIRIKYVNKNNIVSMRCLRDFTIYKVIDKKEKFSFLSGFCLSKDDIRYFNVERISWIEMIDIRS
jgi:hypothetical protein